MAALLEGLREALDLLFELDHTRLQLLDARFLLEDYVNQFCLG